MSLCRPRGRGLRLDGRGYLPVVCARELVDEAGLFASGRKTCVSACAPSALQHNSLAPPSSLPSLRGMLTSDERHRPMEIKAMSVPWLP